MCSGSNALCCACLSPQINRHVWILPSYTRNIQTIWIFKRYHHFKRMFSNSIFPHLPIQLQSPCCHAGACWQHQHSIWPVCHLWMWFIQSQNRLAFGSLQPKSCHWISPQIDDSSVFDQGWWNKTIVYSVLSQGSFSRERMLELWRTSVAIHGVFIRVNRPGILLGCASQWLFSKSYI